MHSLKHIFSTLFFFIAALPILGQQVSFDNVRHEFGSVMWQNPCRTTFKMTNHSTTHLTIKDVRTDCGCTVAQWDKSPIAPGASATITATFDAELLGHFEKQVMVYTNVEAQPYTLVLSGDVILERKGDAGNYPYHIGDIYLNSDNVEFDDVHRGDMPVKTLQIYNAGRQSFEPELMHLPKYLTVQVEPKVVRPGRVGYLHFILNSELLRSFGLTQTNVYMSRFAGDRIHSNNDIYVSATLIPEQTYTDAQLSIAPRAELDSTAFNLGSFGKKKKLKGETILRNTGKSPLKITALQVYNPGLSVSLNKRTLEPGQSAKLKVTVHATTTSFKGRRRVLLITNDPSNSKIIVDVTVKK